MKGSVSMVKKRNKDDIIFDTVVISLLILTTICILLPFFNIISMSVSDEYAIMRGDVFFWPEGFSLRSYQKVFATNTIINAYGNTIFVAFAGCFFSLIMTSLAAYPLVFGDFSWRKLYSIFIMITMWFNGGLIPAFLVMNALDLTDTLWALILVSLINPYHVLVLKAFFASLPASMAESARIDGANDFYILWRIVTPLSKAAFATIGLWVIVLHWNDYLNPLVYLRTYNKYTLQLILRDLLLSTSFANSLSEMVDGNSTALPEQLKYAIVVVAMAPMLIIYPFFQRYFVKGVMIGAVKG